MVGENRAVLALLLLTYTDPLTYSYATDVYWGTFEAGVEPGIHNSFHSRWVRQQRARGPTWDPRKSGAFASDNTVSWISYLTRL